MSLEAELAALEELPLYLTVPQVAAVLGVAEITVWRLIERDELVARHVGRAARIPRASLVAYIRRQAGEGVPGPATIQPPEQSASG